MTEKTITTVLAFDWGSKKIGVAVGQMLTRTATPLPEIPARDGIPNWDTVQTLVEEWQPDAFVVGVPLNMDDTENECTPRARKLGNRLNARYQRPWFAVDERLSSFDARKTLASNARQTGVTPKKGRLMDSVAAALILETWFASQPETKE